MTTLPTRFYRDPLEILEWQERFTCKGCIHKAHLFGREFCGNDKRKNGSTERRCKHYSTETED